MVLMKPWKIVVVTDSEAGGVLRDVYVWCRAAYKWWSEALDALLGIQNAVQDWRSVLKNPVDVSADLLKRCGLWGCLLAAVISSNMAQYVLLTAQSATMWCDVMWYDMI